MPLPLRTFLQPSLQATNRSQISQRPNKVSDPSIEVSAGGSFLLAWSMEEPCFISIPHTPQDYGKKIVFQV